MLIIRNKYVIFVALFICCYSYYMVSFLFRNYDCMEKMKVNRIQIPKNERSSYDWGTSTIYDKIGWVFNRCDSNINKKTILTEKDTLPQDVLEPKLNSYQSEELYQITVELFNHFDSRGIVYFPVFGSLLAAYRNKISILPWDDDLDLVVDNRDGNFMSRFTDGLTEYKVNGQCPLRSVCKMWYLTEDIIITYKSRGVPYKISMRDKFFPVIDITTFEMLDNDNVYTPVEELSTGHIHKFEKKLEWIFPLHREQVTFSMNKKDKINIYLPYKSSNIIIDDYGNDALTTCITSHNHKLFCQDGNCEHVSANHLPKLVFPCSLLEGVI